MDRRLALKLILFSGLSGFSQPMPILANILYPSPSKRSFSLIHPNTQENVETVYWENDHYIRSALAEINYFLRDRRTDEIKPIDTNLLELLFAIKKTFNTQEPFHVLSAYRSPETNAMLRKKGKRASKTSYHKQGKAADIRVPGYRLSTLRRAATRLRSGGVGYYPRCGFIHVDVGPVRYW